MKALSDLRKRIDETRKRLDDARHARAWQAANPLDPPSNDPKVIFSIPLVSRERSSDWNIVERNLARTIASLHRQTDPNWTALICGQDKPGSVTFDDRIIFLKSEAPTVFYDKPYKANELARWVLQNMAGQDGYMFPIDADDIPHPDLNAHMRRDNNGQGYLIDKGYMYDAETGRLAYFQWPDKTYPGTKPFFYHCGSCRALRFDLRGGADFSGLLLDQPSHRLAPEHARRFGFKLAPIPFHAMIYMMNHGENMQVRRERMPRKMKHFRRSPVPAEIGETVIETFMLPRPVAPA